MRDINEDTITQAVLAAMADCKDRRLLQVVTSLVQHLHAFAREVKLTEEEWFKGISFLSAAGKITDDKRQEFILLSDVLGLSMLVMAQNNVKAPGYTESTVFGPFYVEGAPRFDNGADISNGAHGKPCHVQGTVKTASGAPLANAVINVWQSDEEGFYDVQDRDFDVGFKGRGELRSDADGRFHFWSILASHYPIPHDGPVGKLLEALGRHPWRPAHLHFMIEAPGFQRLITHVFREGDIYLESDAVFGVRSSLVAEWKKNPAGSAPDGKGMKDPFYTLTYNFVLSEKVGEQ